jgi:hypothetical protein
MLPFSTFHSLRKTRRKNMSVLLILLFLPPIFPTLYFHVRFQITPYPSQYTPPHSSELLESYTNVPKLMNCLEKCNQNVLCRTVEFSPNLGYQCRLFMGMSSTGMISISNDPNNKVGSVILEPEFYVDYGESCNAASMSTSAEVYDRYLVCNGTASTLQCPSMTFWNGSICVNQGYNGSACNSSSMCRTDLNLTCLITTETCRVAGKRVNRRTI